jgi:hypothetical protein
VIQHVVKFIIIHFGYLLNTESRDVNHLDGFPNTYLVVDGTEVLIVANSNNTYSGKKKRFTIKYQLKLGATTGRIHYIFGLLEGRVHGSNIYQQSEVADWLEANHEICLGDLGYVGYMRVKHGYKRTHELFKAELEYNVKLSKIRGIVCEVAKPDCRKNNWKSEEMADS